jgi:hypothetical protein
MQRVDQSGIFNAKTQSGVPTLKAHHIWKRSQF